MIPIIEFNNILYPKFQSEGFAAKFAFPFAKELLKDDKEGYDIGCNRLEWKYPGELCLPIDLTFNNGYDAYHLPDDPVDYIFSSHCLEHLTDWVGALDYWLDNLRQGGILFLYLPHPIQEYWLPWNNRKHIHSLYPEMIRKYFKDKGLTKSWVTEYDLNYSFYAVAEKIMP